MRITAADLVDVDVAFEPAEPPRAGTLVLDGSQRVAVGDAVEVLVRTHLGGRPLRASAADRAREAILALETVAEGRIIPVMTAGGTVWRPDNHTASAFVAAVVDAFVSEGPGLALRVELDERQRFWIAVDGPAADLALTVRRAAAVWLPLARLLDTAVPDRAELDDDDVVALLSGAAARLQAEGVRLTWAGDLGRGPTAQARLDPVPGSDVALRWQLDLDGTALTPDELDALARSQRPVLRLRDRWVLADPRLQARAQHRRIGPAQAMTALAAALTGTVEVTGVEVEVAPGVVVEGLRRRVARRQDISQPDGLVGTLRGYQLDGLRWLAAVTDLGLGGCLADDMGLGKTVTVIALHLHRAAGPTLVVCPASLLGTWEREIRRFAPGVEVRRFHGAGRVLDGVLGGFVLTTYATLRIDPAALAVEGGWGLVVADEAQHVKNPRARTARALRTVPAAARVALTGTPVENSLDDLWAILDWTTPGLLGTRAAFRRRWAAPIRAGDELAAERFARLIGPVVLRRRKADPGIADELPAKTVTDHAVALTPEQAGLYEAVVREALSAGLGTGTARRGAVVALLTALKQICNHPAQYLHEPNPRLAGRSGKLELLDELLDTILAEGGAVLVFTQYVVMARLLERHLRRRGIATALLHGGTPVADRDALVARFQAGEVPVFLLSLRAAGTGLTLTRADHVVHVDRWWNPAVEDQATDRAHRIGQTRPVQVHRIVTEGTLEERIAAVLDGKRDLAASILDTGWTELTDDQLADLVALREPQ